MTTMDKRLEAEIKHSLTCGMRQVTLRQLDAELSELGYRRALDMRCTCTAHNLTTGNHYPAVNWGVSEVDTGRSAFHVESRRDENFRRLQELRMTTFAVVRGAFVTV